MSITVNPVASATPTSPEAPEQATPTAATPHAALLRQVLGHFATGVTVIGARAENGQTIGITANSFNALSLDPPLVLWSLSGRSPNVACFAPNKRFVVNILGAEHQHLAKHFATPMADKYLGVAHEMNEHNIPQLKPALATLQCQVVSAQTEGDHVLIIARVEHCEHQSEGDPLLFYRGRFGEWVER